MKWLNYSIVFLIIVNSIFLHGMEDDQSREYAENKAMEQMLQTKFKKLKKKKKMLKAQERKLQDEVALELSPIAKDCIKKMTEDEIRKFKSIFSEEALEIFDSLLEEINIEKQKTAN